MKIHIDHDRARRAAGLCPNAVIRILDQPAKPSPAPAALHPRGRG
ncbi:hypothetical protein ABZ297_11495 [Nonomuraea sp. NPDC005983]